MVLFPFLNVQLVGSTWEDTVQLFFAHFSKKFYLNIHITYNTTISVISYNLTLLNKNKLYFQKLMLLAIITVTMLTALTLPTLLTLHNVLKASLLTRLNITYNASIAITLQYVILQRTGKKNS